MKNRKFLLMPAGCLRVILLLAILSPLIAPSGTQQLFAAEKLMTSKSMTANKRIKKTASRQPWIIAKYDMLAAMKISSALTGTADDPEMKKMYEQQMQQMTQSYPFKSSGGVCYAPKKFPKQFSLESLPFYTFYELNQTKELSNLQTVKKFWKGLGYSVKKHPKYPHGYQMTSPNQNDKVNCLLKEKYVFVATNDSPDFFETDFKSTVQQIKAIANGSIYVMSVDMSVIPSTQRNLLATVIEAKVKAKLQQRDDESADDYKPRRDNGLARFEWTDGALRDGALLKFHCGYSDKKKELRYHLSVTARPKSRFAGLLKSVTSQRSQWPDFRSKKTAFSFSMCSNLQYGKSQKPNQLFVIGALKKLQLALETSLQQSGLPARQQGSYYTLPSPSQQKDPAIAPPSPYDQPLDFDITPHRLSPLRPVKKKPVPKPAVLSPLFNELIAACRAGKVDMFAQIDKPTSEQWHFVSGIKMPTNRQRPAILRKTMQQLQQAVQQKKSKPFTVTLNATTHRKITFHKIEWTLPKEETYFPFHTQLFSGKTKLLLFIGADTLTTWIGISVSSTGKKNTTLWKFIDATHDHKKIGGHKKVGNRTKSLPPISLHVNGTLWPKFHFSKAYLKQFKDYPEIHARYKKMIPAQGTTDDQFNLFVQPIKNGLRAEINIDKNFVGHQYGMTFLSSIGSLTNGAGFLFPMGGMGGFYQQSYSQPIYESHDTEPQNVVTPYKVTETAPSSPTPISPTPLLSEPEEEIKTAEPPEFFRRSESPHFTPEDPFDP